MGGGQLRVFETPEALAREAAAAFARLARERVAETGRFLVALAGGATPRGLYRALAGPPYIAGLPWEQIHLFWGDERCVPPNHPDSNYRMAEESLLHRIPIPPNNVHRMLGEHPKPVEAARIYAALLLRLLPLTAEGRPRFDLILLGLGTDAHTASLFPGSPLLSETETLVAVTPEAHGGYHRLTFTPPILNAACEVWFLVTGADKAEALRAVLEELFDPKLRPGQIVRPKDGRLIWYLDRAATQHLTQPTRSN